MTRWFVFFAGLLLTTASLPAMLEHHDQARFMAQAWCISSGNGAKTASWLTLHCPACPAVFTGLAAMFIAALFGTLPGTRLRRGRA